MADKKNTSKKSTATKKVTEKKVESKKTTKPATKKPITKVKEEIKIVETPVVEEKVVIKKETKKENNMMEYVKTNSRNLILGAICVLLIINIILITVGHQVKLANGKEVIASIDGKQYTAEELFEKLKEKYGSDSLVNLIDSYISEKELTTDDIKKAKEDAKEYVAGIKSQYESAGYEWETILSQYGYTNEDALVNEYLETVKSELVAKKYIKDAITEDEINEYYKDKIYGNYTVKHILIKANTNNDMSDEEKTAAENIAQATAKEVISKYAAGEDWNSLVTTYSGDDGSKDNGGLIENFTYGDMEDEFFKASVALKDGEYTSEPVKTAYGYHVILKVSATEKPSLKDKKEQILNALVDEKLEKDSKLYNTTWAKIRKKYNLNIEDTTVKKAYEKTISE